MRIAGYLFVAILGLLVLVVALVEIRHSYSRYRYGYLPVHNVTWERRCSWRLRLAEELREQPLRDDVDDDIPGRPEIVTTSPPREGMPPLPPPPPPRGIPCVLFAVDSVSLSETTRLLLLAEHLREKYGQPDTAKKQRLHVAFADYGGVGSFKYDYLIRRAGFPLHTLSPEWETAEDIERFYAIDRGEVLGQLYPEEVLRERVRSELELLERLRPIAVVTGFMLSMRLSAAVANVPYWITLPVLVPNYDFYIEGLFADLLDVIGLTKAAAELSPFIATTRRVMSWSKRLLKWVFPRNAVTRAFIWLFRRVWYNVGSFQKIAVEHTTRPVHYGLLDLMEGDRVLSSDVPEVVGLSEEKLKSFFGDAYGYVGPLFARIQAEIPEEITKRIQETKERSQRNKILYFAMGSSGRKEIVRNILESLDSHFKAGDVPNLNEIGLVVSPTLRLLNKFEGDEEANRGFLEQLDPRIMVTDILPAPEVNDLCDVAIIHGGQGTVQTAASSGLPFVGVPAQPEQSENIKQIILATSREADEDEDLAGAVFVSKSSALASGDSVVVGGLARRLMSNLEERRARMASLQSVLQRYDAREFVEDYLFDIIENKQ